MSQANIPNITPTISLTFSSSMYLLLASIALEEIALAHIINAEGEKLQYVLGTLPGVTPPPTTISDLLAVNASIRETLREVAKQEWILYDKLDSVINAYKTNQE